MNDVRISVIIGPYEAGSVTMGPGAVSVEIEAERGSYDDLKDLMTEAVNEAIRTGKTVIRRT